MNIDDEFYGYSGEEFFPNKESSMENMEEGGGSIEDYRGDQTTSTLHPKSIRERIDETLEILSNLKARKNIKLSRAQLIETLTR